MTSSTGLTTARCALVCDFNAGNLKSYLESSADEPPLAVAMPEYGQVIQTLLDAAHPCWDGQPDVAVIWTRPESVIPTFSKVLACEAHNVEDLLAEVDGFADMISQAAGRARNIMVASWSRPIGNHGLGPIDLRPGGIAYALTHMNLRLAKVLHDYANIFVVNSDVWLAEQKNPAVAFKYWYASKTPFTPDVFSAASQQIKALLRATSGRSRKLLILDLDDTLWGGIVGEVGWENLRLGGHDPMGEAFQDFQRGVKALQNRGIILAVVSKNDEAVALTAVDSHPEMLIRSNDLAGWRINWNDKAQNIVDLLYELNLGLDAAVFIDDNPAERGRVAEALPQLHVPDWPADKLLYRHALNALTCFDPASISSEDAVRSGFYVTERERRRNQSSVSMDEWLGSLELKVRLQPYSERDRQRATQLLNKTNQMNLTTRRLTEAELSLWTSQDNHALWTVWVADRFGDSGLTGLIGIEIRDGICHVVDFVLSCRVFGRQIENVMASVAIAEAEQQGAKYVEALYLPTAKNSPVLEFFSQRSHFEQPEDNRFVWNTGSGYPLPAFIDVCHDGYS